MAKMKLVPVHVPVDDLDAVYETLVERAKARARAATDSAWWSDDDLKAIAEGRQESLVRTNKALDVLAAMPDQAIARSELARRTGLTASELQGAFSGLQRWINVAWDGGGPPPFKITQGPAQTPDQTTESYYRLNADTAARWLRVRGIREGTES